MIRTQIQLPDEIYNRAKELCKTKEISLAELARRGLEYILTVYPKPSDASMDWEMPKPRKMGWKGLSEAEIKAQAQMTPSESNSQARWQMGLNVECAIDSGLRVNNTYV